MMSRVAGLVLALVFQAMCVSALADQNDPRLDPLFERLSATSDPAEAARLTERIWGIWTECEEPDCDALMETGVALLAEGRYVAALERFDRLVTLRPDFAEAWNKRATVHYLLQRYDASVEDIHRTLLLEPRHFGALSGLGMIYLDSGDPEIALKAFRGALAINPHLPGARQNVETLEKELGGSAI